MTEPSSNGARRAQVLVVGAGPVGLMAALCLAQQGVSVEVVDLRHAEEARSYPVVLHARTLRLLSTWGIASPLEWQGREVTRLAIYLDGERHALLELPPGGTASAGALTLPQDVLRQSLIGALSRRGFEVHWQTRLVALDQSSSAVRALLMRRELAEPPPPTQPPEAFDSAAVAITADYVIGADGLDSAVRRLLGLELVRHGPLESYAFFDAADSRAGHEAVLALTGELMSSIYPIHGGRARYSFQIADALHRSPDPARLKNLVEERFPWRTSELHGFEWGGVAEFRKSLSERLGAGRVWLAGDAAHATGPLGVQSLNLGLYEASDLSDCIADGLRSGSSERLEEHYAVQRRLEWERLLGIDQGPVPSSRTPSWVKTNLSRLVPALPASGDDLDDLLDQLRLSLA
jgi:NADPH-dependent dioxygenase